MGSSADSGRERGTHLDDLLAAASDTALVGLDEAGTITDWSHGATCLFGWLPSEVIGSGLDFLYDPSPDLAGARAGGRVRIARWLTGKDGNRIYVEGSLAVTRRRGFVLVMRDATAAQAAAELARISDRDLRLVIDTVPAWIAFLDRDGVYRFINRAGEEWLGLPPGEIIGKRTQDLVQPDHYDARKPFIDRVLAGERLRFEGPSRDRNGRTFHHAIEYIPRRDDSGAVDGFYLLGVDITDRKRLEEDLLRLNETLELRVEERTRERNRVWNNSRDLVAVIGTDGLIGAVSPAWVRILGHAGDGVVGQSFLDVIHDDDREVARNGLAAAIKGGDEAFETRCPRRDGSSAWISWVTSHDAGVTYAFGRDITAEKAQGAALAEAQEHLRQAQKMEAVGQLTGGIAHDFNNMLTGILGSLELMQRRIATGRTGDLDRFIDTATKSAQRATALTHRLLAFSRRQALNARAINVNDLVRSLQELLQRTLGERVGLVVDLPPGLPPASADESQTENALLNLVLNARDAMPDGGELKIATSLWREREGAADLPVGDYIVLAVRDSGVGIPADRLAKVFEPFYTTKPMGHGTGLGLSMVYGFARQTGGTIRLDSAPAQGTTAFLYLPVAEGRADGPPIGAGEAPLGSGQVVLVVEDDPSVRLLVMEVLKELRYTSLEAANAAEAMAVLDSPGRIDLLISDIGLPGMDGRKMAAMARLARPSLPILFMTAYAANADASLLAAIPGAELLTKPFPLEDLAARISAMTQGGPPQ